MPISQQTITGSVKTPANADAAITGVTFKLSKSDFEAGEIIAVNTVAATVDTASGDFTVTLWPNDAGMDGTSTYAMTFNFSDGSAVTGRTYSARNGGALSLRSENTVAGSSHTTTDPIVFNGRVEGTTASRRGVTAHAGMARWNRALSLAEIEAIYSSAQAGA